MSDDRDLVTSEGVDEGSAASSSEGDSAPDPAAAAALGERGEGEPRNDEQDAAPEPIGDDAAGPGQKLQLGEG